MGDVGGSALFLWVFFPVLYPPQVIPYGFHEMVVLGPQCQWQGGGVGCSLPLVPFMGGVLSSSRLGVVVLLHGVVLPSLWHGHHLFKVVVVVSHRCHWLFVVRKDDDEQCCCSLSSCHVDDVAPVLWHLFCGQEGDCGDRLWVLTWGWTQHCHCQTSVDMPCHCRRLPLTCWLLMWHFCVVRMVYWHVQVVDNGQR